jgi:NUMOD3 motif
MPWPKGRKHSEEEKKKVSNSKRGIKRKPFSDEWIRNMSISQKGRVNLGSNNSQWRGDNVKRVGLHMWVRRNYPVPELCEICNLRPQYDLANVTGIYNREFSNWKYICRRCHMHSDGRIFNLKQYAEGKEETLLSKS